MSAIVGYFQVFQVLGGVVKKNGCYTVRLTIRREERGKVNSYGQPDCKIYAFFDDFPMEPIKNVLAEFVR